MSLYFIHAHGQRPGINPPRQQAGIETCLVVYATLSQSGKMIKNVEKPLGHTSPDSKIVQVENRAERVVPGIEGVQKTGKFERCTETSAPLEVAR